MCKMFCYTLVNVFLCLRGGNSIKLFAALLKWDLHYKEIICLPWEHIIFFYSKAFFRRGLVHRKANNIKKILFIQFTQWRKTHQVYPVPLYSNVFVEWQTVQSGWCGVVKVSCISRHRGIQLILAYRWARPAILVAVKGRGGMFYFFCFFTFIPVPLSSLSLSFISSTISSIIFSAVLWDTTQNDPQGLTCR